MIRIVFFLLAVTALALGAMWIVERPGEIVLTWQGWRISTSVTVALIALAALLVTAIVVWSLLRFFVTAPGNLSMFLTERRRARGWRALSRGMIAAGAGNLALARNSANEAQKILGHEPLAMLLAAQAAQLDGDAPRAEAEFRAMLAQPETRLLGLRGLYLEARRRDDHLAARDAAEEAAKSDAGILWASEALLEFQSIRGEWDEAIATVEREAKAGAIDKPMMKRRRAVLLTAQGLTIEHNDPSKALVLAREAAKLAPSLVPAAALAGRLEARDGSPRRAQRVIEKAWAIAPHPELAESYGGLRPQDAAKERLLRIKSLARKNAEHPEATIAIARAAIDAQDFVAAREALLPFAANPTQAMCLMMAELEALDHGDHGKAREWTVRAVRAKRDLAWVADGFISERWLPASPVTGRLDAFEWKEPPVAPAGPILEHVVEQGFAKPAPAPAAVPPSVAAKPSEDILLVPEDARPRAPVKRPAIAPIIAEPPLPDDPGLDPERDDDAEASKSVLRGWFNRPA
ncbi:MAG: heme biosynthesis protein HemY [Xanthobacteraceae bacterium]|nr:heme biosynthesis protein HemY [Xanthobacteraceae bacterium]